MARIFGKVWLLDGKWHMEGEPHLLIRAKRIFARIWAAEHGVVTLKNTDEVCRDIDWFLHRYPMEMAPGDKRILKRGSERHIETMATLDQLIDQNYTGREFKMGLPPRDYQKLAASILLERGFLLLADELGTGKAQPLDAKVLTPTGWKMIGDLQVGDMVIDPDGGHASITGVYAQGMKDIYRITLASGETTECCDEHLWLIRTPSDLIFGGERVCALKDFKSQLVYIPVYAPSKQGQEIPEREFNALDSVEFVAKKEAICIRVSSKRSLYVTDGYIVTHNTVSALAALTDRRTLPAIVVTLTGTMPMQWQSMTWRFMPSLTTHIITKGTPYELPRIKARGPDVVIINYHKLTGWAETLAAYGRSIIFDEAQELRRAGSKKYEGAKFIARQMKFRLGASATPIFNLGGEIWNVVDVLQEDALGTWPEFVREWCYGERSYDGKAPAVRDPKALGSYLRSEHIMLRRTRKDIGRELPPLTTIPQYIDSDESALDSVKDSAAQLAKIIMSNEKVAGWDRMKAAEEFSQVMRQATGISKAPYVADFIRLIVDGDDEPVVVFAWHRAVYDILLAKLNDLAPAMYTGTESAVKKQEALDRFTKGETKVLLMSLRSGIGVDGLQHVCRTAIFAELDWTPGIHSQCVGRLFRDGQKEPVTAVFLVAERGADPVMAETLGLKTAQLDGINDPDKPIVEVKLDDGHIRKLAQRYLEKAGRKQVVQLPVAVEDEKEETVVEEK
jgi:superfamily II DNA or RNA helicase